MQKENIAHIVYAADDRFAEIMGVSLTSLLENSKDMDDIVIYILDSGINQNNRKKIVSVCQAYNRSCPRFIPAKDISKELDVDMIIDRGSLSQYARLFISSSLPSILNKVLYLDCDIILNKSIRELWELDLQGNIIAALMDCFSKFYRSNIDLSPNDIMFNSGVMLIDLDKWKKQNIEEQLLEFVRRKKGKVQQGDQGVLNSILSHDTFCFAPRFNSITIFYDFSYKEMMIYRKPPEFYSEEDVRQAVDDPSIIHFTTSFLSKRPWMYGCEHKYVGIWMKYKKISPWKDTPLWKDNRSKWAKNGERIIRKLPRDLGIRLAGFLHAYGRPIVNRLKGWLQS